MIWTGPQEISALARATRRWLEWLELWDPLADDWRRAYLTPDDVKSDDTGELGGEA